VAQEKPEPARAWHYESVTENYFVGSIASEYQAKWPHLFDPAVVDPAVDFLAAQAGAGPVLELGIGTGRLALPLSRRHQPPAVTSGTDSPADPRRDVAGVPRGRNMRSVFDYDVDVNTGRCPRARGR
jgi:hypothetical protein